MTDTVLPKKSTTISWLFWWQTDPDELQKQVEQYKTLKIYQSSKGIRFLFLLLTTVVTALFVLFVDRDKAGLIDALIFLILGIFIFRGHRWSMIAAMVLWTIAKGEQLVDYSSSKPSTIITPILWWTTYLHAFWMAFKVEGLRKQQRKVQNGGTITEYAASTENLTPPTPPAPPVPTVSSPTATLPETLNPLVPPVSSQTNGHTESTPSETTEFRNN